MRFAPSAVDAARMGLLFGGLLGCASAPSATPPGSSDGDGGTLTYYRDIQPIIQAKCAQCHNPTGIGPFSFETANDIISRKALVQAAVVSKTMPPWPPSDSCSSYAGDRSLSDAQIATITDWINEGASVGDSATRVTATTPVGMSRVDLTLQMPDPFTPNQTPDDYRCFLLDWTPATAEYVTGLGVRPGNPKIVHHTIAFVATPSQVAEYQSLDDADPGLGWTCFGGPGLTNLAETQWLGAWAPGALGSDFPSGTGVLVEPGSKIVLQLHYNTSNSAPTADQTSVDVELADSVAKPAAVVPFANPAWLQGAMSIPAGAPDQTYSFAVDVTPYLSQISANVLSSNVPVTIYGGGLHMHTRGTHIKTSILHADASEECMVDIPAWDFNWQGQYDFTQPKIMSPGDQVYLECHWDNTAQNQPYVGGQQVPVTDLNWGETTEDEMCLGVFYVTE